MHDGPGNPGDMGSILVQLEGMPDFLTATFAGLSAADAARQGTGGWFSPVEHCWHLADIEREGFAVRIRRILDEDDPALPDLDGARLARERRHLALSLPEGIAAFRRARVENVHRLRRLTAAERDRPGTLEGVGRITLGEIPALLSAHDTEHGRQVDAWLREHGGR